MKIWHISDTHGYHKNLLVPKDIDLVIHSGDATNYRDPYRNEKEMRDFISWYYNLDIPNKVMIAGNHDSSIESTLVHPEDIKALGIHYLFMDSITILGLKIWGAPFVPSFGDWAFMKSRSDMMVKVWDFMDKDSDIVVTHTPPKGILDVVSSHMQINNEPKDGQIFFLENVGCASLFKKIIEVAPKLHCFGHIHGSPEVYNSGVLRPSNLPTIFSNGSCCSDRKKGRFEFFGNVIEL